MDFVDYLPIDHLFAEQLLPRGEGKAKEFLSHLLKSAREGHLCLPVTEAWQEALSLLPPSLFDDYLVQERGCIYLRRNWECEKKFLFHLARLRGHPPTLPITLKKEEMLNQEQNEALIKVASQSLTLITGGPGSGKTYTAAVLIRRFLEQGVQEIAVAAPTGKAAANLRVALGALASKCVVKTLHSLMKSERLYADLIVVDEGSMIDAELMAQLFSAVNEGARLVLLGDQDQLPPVESGHFFADLTSQSDLVAPLKKCLRAELQEIIDLAAHVKQGKMVPFQPLPSVKELVQSIADQKIPVLTPLRKGLYGVDHLNQLLYLEDQKRGVDEIPILIRVNTPALGLYNGDLGRLNKKTNTAYFCEERVFAEHKLPYYEYAYVLSIHKSQGSEYDRVRILLPQGSEVFGRELLYTAVTRAKKEATIYADLHVMECMLANRFHRHSGLNAYPTHLSRLPN